MATRPKPKAIAKVAANEARPGGARDGAPGGTAGSAPAGGRRHEVVERILELVRTGNLKPGDRLPPERELIEIFGIGRPKLREGLRALDALGVTESRHGGGAYISDLDARRLLAPLDFYLSLTRTNMDESFDCRRVIEVEAVRQGVVRASEADVAKLRAMLEAHATIGDDPVGFRILDSRFHAFLWDLAGNAILMRLCHALYNLGLDLRRRATESAGHIAHSTADHAAIVAAFAARDPAAAGEAMRRHIDHITVTTRQAMGQDRRMRGAGRR